jgi:hypothetical protein
MLDAEARRAAGVRVGALPTGVPGGPSASRGPGAAPSTLIHFMSTLTVFGLFAVTAMLVFYALEERNPLFILCFAAACVLGSIYGFLQGAWPFGLVEAVWAAVAARRWWLKRNP